MFFALLFILIMFGLISLTLWQLFAPPELEAPKPKPPTVKLPAAWQPRATLTPAVTSAVIKEAA